jgi:hypothetical protein
MARKPSTPADAPAGAPADPKADGSGRTKHIVTGAAIGIGSAALVAALLYANRARKTDRTNKG